MSLHNDSMPHPYSATRRTLLTDYYDLPAHEQANDETLFAQMDALANECADQGEFEKRLAASPLTGKYTDLLTRLAPYAKKDAAHEAQLKREQAAGRRQTILDNARRKTRSTVLHELNNKLPIDGYKWGQAWYYAIPVIGPILKDIFGTIDQAKSLQHMGRNLFSRQTESKESEASEMRPHVKSSSSEIGTSDS